MATLSKYRKLYVKIKLEILGADLIIEDADMSVELTKTDESKNNSCTITIYNLSDETYTRINNKTNAVRCYVDIDGDGYVLFFQGNLRELQKHKKARSTTSKRKKKARKNAVIHYNEPAITRELSGSDEATKIVLQDGMQNYFLQNYVSRSYAGQVTNKYILQDILTQAKKTNNIEVSADFDDMEEYTFPNGYTAQGSFKSVIGKLANMGKCQCKINNNIVVIRKDSIDVSNWGYVLNGDICTKPEAKTDKQIEILAPFLPSINPLDFVRLDFKDYEGVYRVKGIESKIDNFGQDYETKVTVTYK